MEVPDGVSAPRGPARAAGAREGRKAAGLALRKWLKRCLPETGFKKVCLKSDNKSPIVALKKKVKEKISLKIHLVEVPKIQANGYVEVSVQEIKRQIRAMLSDLQKRLGKTADPAPMYDVVATPCSLSAFKVSCWT